MDEFLEYIRRARAELRKQLEELDVAERVYMDQQKQIDPVLPPPSRLTLPGIQIHGTGIVGGDYLNPPPKTIKDMVLKQLNEEYPGGLTALEILDRIQKRWKPVLERTSLSPQLTRLRASGSIQNDKHKWYLVTHTEKENPNASPDDAGEASE